MGWRDVPTNEGVLGEIALSSLPRIEQIFVNAPAGWRPRRYGAELQRETLSIVGWRDVPTNEGVLGEIALSSLPRIEQIFVNAPAGWRPRDMERRLFIARRRIEKRLEADKDFYVCSLSNLVNIYKGLCMPADLPRFYLDLADLRLESAICLFRPSACFSGIGHLPVSPALFH